MMVEWTRGSKEDVMRKTLLTVFATILLAGVAVAGDYTAPVVEGKRVMPDYPPAALAAGFEGVVK